MIIPWQQLSEEILRNIIEEFVLREGTDYGEHEVGFEEKVLQVQQQLKNNQAAILYSELHETVTITRVDNPSFNIKPSQSVT